MASMEEHEARVEGFDAGVVWTLELLKKYINARTDALDAALRMPSVDSDVGRVLNSTAQVLVGALIHFETDTMKQLTARRVLLKKKK
jgi:CHASE3 domain sensor protein